VRVIGMPTESVLDQLERSGLARIGSGKLPRGFWRASRPEDPSETVRAAADAERREGV